jgi:hypothetical protein
MENYRFLLSKTTIFNHIHTIEQYNALPSDPSDERTWNVRMNGTVNACKECQRAAGDDAPHGSIVQCRRFNAINASGCICIRCSLNRSGDVEGA